MQKTFKITIEFNSKTTEYSCEMLKEDLEYTFEDMTIIKIEEL